MKASEQTYLNESLFHAIDTGRLSAVKKAVCLGADLAAVTKGKQTPLFYAINQQAPVVIQNYLIDRTFQVNFVSVNGLSVLQLAVHKNAPALAKLLQHPALDINYQSITGSALNIAINENKPEIVKQLLTHPDIWVNARNAEQETPLIQAVILQRPEIVALLLKHKDINVHLAHPLMGSPAQIAFRSGNGGILSMLKSKDAVCKMPLLHHMAAERQKTYA